MTALNPFLSIFAFIFANGGLKRKTSLAAEIGYFTIGLLKADVAAGKEDGGREGWRDLPVPKPPSSGLFDVHWSFALDVRSEGEL